MIFEYNNQYISEEEMREIEEMEAAWNADLEQKIEVIKNSMANDFAYAISPLYEIKEINNVPTEEKMDVLAKIQGLMEKCCAINTYSNNLEELDSVNSLPIDYTILANKQYDTVSYIMPSDENGEPIVLAYNLR